MRDIIMINLIESISKFKVLKTLFVWGLVQFICIGGFADYNIAWGDWCPLPGDVQNTKPVTDVAIAVYQNTADNTGGTYFLVAAGHCTDYNTLDVNKMSIYMWSGKLMGKGGPHISYYHITSPIKTSIFSKFKYGSKMHLSLALANREGTATSAHFMVLLTDITKSTFWNWESYSPVFRSCLWVMESQDGDKINREAFKVTPGSEWDITSAADNVPPNSITLIRNDSDGQHYLLTLYYADKQEIFYMSGTYALTAGHWKWTSQTRKKLCTMKTYGGSDFTPLICEDNPEISKGVMVANNSKGKTAVYVAGLNPGKGWQLEGFNEQVTLDKSYYSVSINAIPNTLSFVLVYGDENEVLKYNIGTFYVSSGWKFRWKIPGGLSLNDSTEKNKNSARASAKISADGKYIMVAQMQGKHIYIKLGIISQL
jgi:hypothetical protein